MSFLETPRFPDNISYGSRGGPKFMTNVAAVESGFEKRTVLWSTPIHEYDVSYGVKTLDQLLHLKKFFLAVKGRGNGFRIKDFADYSTAANVNDAVTATDEDLGIADGVQDTFLLQKTYTVGSMTTTRMITKPVAASVLVALDGVLQTITTDYALDSTTGELVFTSPPAAFISVTWGGEFDVPARFDTDMLDVSHDFFEGGSTSILVRELRL